MASIMTQTKGAARYSPMGVALNSTMKGIRETGTYVNAKKEVEVKELSAVIANFTNLKGVRVMMDPTLRQNAYVHIPMIFKNNPMMYDWWREWFGDELEEKSRDALKGKNSGKVLDAWVDREEGKVFGWYQDIDVPIYIGYDAVVSLKGGWDTTEGEICGVISHEIGHVITMLIAMSYMARTNQVLYDVHKSLLGVGGVEDRVRILRQTAARENIDLDDVESLARQNNKDAVTTVVVGGMLRRIRSELGNDIYDMRGFESLADNFAAKHGYALDLVTALDKMSFMSGQRAGRVKQTLMAIFELMVHIAVSVTTFGFYALLLFFVFNPTEKIYDDPKDRFQRLRNELVNQLKDNTIPTLKRQQILDDLSQIDGVMARYHGNRTVYETIYEFIRQPGREANLARKLNQQFEKMANNELYVMSAKLQQLGA